MEKIEALLSKGIRIVWKLFLFLLGLTFLLGLRGMLYSLVGMDIFGLPALF